MTTMNQPAAAAAEDPHLTATRVHLGSLAGDELVAWRVADVPDRPSADERNLQDQFTIGWFGVCFSDELAVGQVISSRFFAENLAIWRGEDGLARVTSAYCAHYGANMAIGGKVHGNLLECPFHAWRWDGDGACKEIPYAKNIPPQARRADCVPSRPTAEMNGMVLIWYHPDHAAPLWDPVDFGVVGQEGWTDFQKFRWNVFTAQENMADNAVDVGHFKYVHGAMTVPEYEYEFDGIKRAITSFLKLKTPKGEINGKIDSVNYGPGQGMVRFTGLTETILIAANTPIERDKTLVRFAFTQPLSEVDGPRGNLTKALIKDIVRQFDQDKVILDQHVRVSPPLVCDGDGPFGRNSLYYSQFYVRDHDKPKAA